MTKKSEKQKLKEIVQNIVIGQGNDHIKELLRTNKIKIGSTKSDFLKNIIEAIDEEKFTLSMLIEWIEEVEGWGTNTYIYINH